MSLAHSAFQLTIPLLIASQGFSANSASESPTLKAEQTGQGDIICGPRCVAYILEHYGRDEELVTLVRETQWPRMDQGASLDALRQSLAGRGVHTAAIRISPEAELVWPHPVLVHLKPPASQSRPRSRPENNLGHYVVWLPDSSASHVRLWSGLPGVMTGTRREFVAHRSGVVLLTAPEPIRSTDAAVRRIPLTRHASFWISLTAAATLFAAVFLGRRTLSRLGHVRFPEKEKTND